MKTKTITVSITRQVTQFNPINIQMEVELEENEKPSEVIKATKDFLIRNIYGDKPEEMNKLIIQLVHSGNNPEK